MKKFTDLTSVCLLFICLLAICGCKKNQADYFLIKGHIQDSIMDFNSSGVTVIAEYESSTQPGQYYKVGEAHTDIKGNFTLQIINKETKQYRLIATKTNYFTLIKTMPISELTHSDTNRYELYLYPKGVLQILISPNLTTAQHATLSLELINEVGFNTAYSTHIKVFHSASEPDTSLTLNVMGKSWTRMHYTVEHDSVGCMKTDSAFCRPFNTTVFEVNY